MLTDKTILDIAHDEITDADVLASIGRGDDLLDFAHAIEDATVADSAPIGIPFARVAYFLNDYADLYENAGFTEDGPEYVAAHAEMRAIAKRLVPPPGNSVDGQSCGSCGHWHATYSRCQWTPPILVPIAWHRALVSAHSGGDCPCWRERPPIANRNSSRAG